MDRIVAYVRGRPVATAWAVPGGPLRNAYGMRFDTVIAFYNFAYEMVYFAKHYESHTYCK